MHIYQDTSHFRAPYKSLLSVAGFGQEAPVAAPSTFEVTPMQMNAAAPMGADGIRRYTPASAAQLMKNLEQWNTIQQAAGVVKVEPYTQAQLDAGKTDPAIASFMAASNGAAWTRARVAEGNAVYAPFSLMWPTQPAMDAGIFLGTTPYTDKAAMQALSALPIGAYLAEPGALDEDGEWLENIAIAAGITVGVGLAVWALRKYMKRGGPLEGKLSVPNKRLTPSRMAQMRKSMAVIKKARAQRAMRYQLQYHDWTGKSSVPEHYPSISLAKMMGMRRISEERGEPGAELWATVVDKSTGKVVKRLP